MNEYLQLFQQKKMVLIMSLPKNNPAWCKAAFEAGADAVKVHINVDHHASGTHFGRLSEEAPKLEDMLAHRTGPMGIVLGGSLEAVEQDCQAINDLPFSFYSVYAHHIPAWMPHKNAALMAACDSTYPMHQIAQMPFLGADVVEASVIPGNEYGLRLSMRDLLQYRAITQAVSVPVVVPTQRAIRPDEAARLMEAGVQGLMIGAIVTGQEERSIAAAVAAFRKAIDEV